MFDVISAGHLCVDISPKFTKQSVSIDEIFVAGKLTNVNEINFATGGASANVGIALKKLGIETTIIGKTGVDEIGNIISRILNEENISSENIIRKKGENSSYTIVLAPPGVDRIFLHFTGANDTFSYLDLDFKLLMDAKLFHFGYPPLMQQFYSHNGDGLVEMMKKAKATGITTSLDMSLPDPNSPSGKADWEIILSRVLKYVDIFLPSVEELLYMLDRKYYNHLKMLNSDILKNIDIECLTNLSDKLLKMGCKIIVIKCGKAGYYLRTADNNQLLQLGRGEPGNLLEWESKELFSTVFDVENVVSSTGAGDCSIAGFIAALLSGCSPERAINVACGVGSISVTAPGATKAVITLDEIIKKIENGWRKNGEGPKSESWVYDESHDIYYKKNSNRNKTI